MKKNADMAEERKFYRVASDFRDAPLRDHHFHGFETMDEFEQALRRLVKRWKGRIGEAITERHDFILLRFHDTPGGKPDEEWLPRYLLKPSPMPEYMLDKTAQDEMEKELDDIFGFD